MSQLRPTQRNLEGDLMKVQMSTLRRAFFGVYRELATAESYFVSVHDLRDHWHVTGLRHSDLPAVLQDLVRVRMLHALERENEPVVRLTNSGVAAFHQPDTALVPAIGDRLTLMRLQLRRLRQTLAWQRRQRKRRRDDRG